MRHLLLVGLLLYTNLLTAQTICRSRSYKNISWAGIVEQDFIVDAPCHEGDYLNEQQTLKFVHPLEEADIWEGNYLVGVVLKAVQSGTLEIYKDPECLLPVSAADAFTSGDTVVSFDPDTYEERLFFGITQTPDPESISRWRVRGELYYDRKRAVWDLRDISLAPLIAMVDRSTGEAIFKPAFWFKARRDRQRINARRITWAKYLVPRDTGSFIDLHSVRATHAEAPEESPYAAFLNACNDRQDIPLYSGTRFGGEYLLDPAERRSMLSSIDTVVIFDPFNYEETVRVVQRRVTPESIAALRLIHTWYWDRRRQQLFIDIPAAAPMLPVTDYKGRLQFYRPLFYRRNT